MKNVFNLRLEVVCVPPASAVLEEVAAAEILAEVEAGDVPGADAGVANL